MFNFRNGILELTPPEWVVRLIAGRRQFDAAVRSVEERAKIHGKAAATLRIGRVVQVEIQSERED